MEALPGTDWMLESIRKRPDGRSGGILFKGPKPGQDRRIDMPTIGPNTVATAAAAGLDGIVIAEGGVLAVDLQVILSEADAKGLFIWVRDAA